MTGGAGLLGTRLLRALEDRCDRISVLDLPGAISEDFASGSAENVEIIRGDLLEPDTYAHAISEGCSILHLAAMTGQASEELHFRVNLNGTEALLEQSRRAGVARFLFISTIAVNFPDKKRYFYAQAKQAAEEAVRQSKLPFVIVRPTIIAAPGSPVLAGLERLACLPFVLVPGNGAVKVQPVWVGDLVDFILGLMDRDWQGETFDLGGPSSPTIEELMQEIRLIRGGGTARSLHLPIRPLLSILGIAEALGIKRLPVTAGQLSSFRFDGIAETWPPHIDRPDGMMGVRQMLELSLVT
jgi:NADH dehydrogenase